jgi:ornithine cyclodeaminase/alanine dehydrogenase-like protein (mu-crystallin family)
LLATSQPESIVAFGAGSQIEAHLDLHLRHFPSLKRCTIVNRSRNHRALSLHKKISDKFTNVTVGLLAPTPKGTGSESESDVKRALGHADLVICATSSTIPLFPSAYVREGTHIILIGSYKPDMKEVDRDLISRSLKGTLLVDSKDACLREAGELIDARVQPEELKEFGQLLPADSQGDLDLRALDKVLDEHRPKKTDLERSFEGPVSIFKSVGLGIQDVAIAVAVVQKALDSSGQIGTVIPKYD